MNQDRTLSGSGGVWISSSKLLLKALVSQMLSTGITAFLGCWEDRISGRKMEFSWQALNRAAEGREQKIRGGRTLEPSPIYSFTEVPNAQSH